MKQIFSTEDVGPEQRYGFWQDAVSRSFFSVDTVPLDGRPFFGRFEKVGVGGIGLAHLQSSPQTYERSAAQCRSSGEELIYVDYQISGASALEQFGRSSTIRPGELMLYDSTRPMRNRLESDGPPTSVLMMCLPRAMVASRIPDISSLCARTFSVAGDQSSYLLSLWRSSLAFGATLSAMQGVMAAELMLDCLTSFVGATIGAAPRPADDKVSAEQVLDVIAARVRDPKLSAERVANILSISPRTLHRRLADAGTTPEQAIVAARVACLRKALEDPARAGRSITTLAFDCGFSDSATASRMFRRIVGRSPGEHRAESLGKP